MSNIISYNGKVHIVKIRRGIVTQRRVLKNTGTNRLFNFLCSCLSDNFDSSLSPKSIDICYAPNNETLSESSFTSMLLTNGVLTVNRIANADSTYDSPCSVTMSTTISSNMLNGLKPSSTGYSLFYVLRDGKNNILAYVKDINTNITPETFNVANDSVLIITWELALENSTNSDEVTTVLDGEDNKND